MKNNNNIHLVLKMGLAFFVLLSGINANAETVENNKQKICKEKLESIQSNDKNFSRLNKIFKEHAKFGFQRHTMMPGFHSDYQDIVEARKKLSIDDVPYIVYELARVERPNNKQITAMGVLGQFGLEALPCIDAQLEKGNCPGCFNLGQTKISINVNEKVKQNKFD